MSEPTSSLNPFLLLMERDSDRTTPPHLASLRALARVPVAGICTIAGQREYGGRQRHAEAIRLMRELLNARDMAVVEIDTRWPAERNSGGLGSSAQVASVI